jgi:RNA polymerase sigma factor (sigma-70 family)
MEESRSAATRPGHRGRSERIASLMKAARDGDHDALGHIVAELSPVLWHVARAAGLSSGDAEDVMQTTWTALVTHLGSVRDPGALIGWLVVTTRREAWRVRETGRRQLPADAEWLSTMPDPGPGSEDQVIISEQRQALWAAVRRLSPRCQELIRIVAFVPRPDYRTVAAELGMPAGSIGPTRGRCLAKLRALLGTHALLGESS